MGMHDKERITAVNADTPEERIGEIWMVIGGVVFLVGLFVLTEGWQVIAVFGGMCAIGLGLITYVVGKAKARLSKP